MSRRKVVISKEELYDLYWNKGMSLREIGKIYGVTPGAIGYHFKKHNIKTRPPEEYNKGRTPMKGKKHSEETKKKLRELGSGVNHPNYGKHHSEYTKKKIGDGQRNHQLTNKNPFYGKKHTEETRKKMSENHVDFSGENHPRWNGGSSYEPYCHKFTLSLKEEVRGRYNRLCAMCGKTEKENGQKLSVHHTDEDKMQGCNGKKWSLIPLCRSCHSKVTNQKRNENIL